MGGETAPRPYPYQISLQVLIPIYIAFFPTGRKEYTHNCGGSIVSENCVLTAAHCVVDYKPKDLSILAGTNKLRGGGGGERYYIQEIKVHPNYEELVTSDIAVMKINGTFKFSDKIAPTKYSDREIGGKENCTLTGYYILFFMKMKICFNRYISIQNKTAGAIPIRFALELHQMIFKEHIYQRLRTQNAEKVA